MKTLLFSPILTLFVLFSSGQDKKWVLDDVNRDGVKDSICTFYDGGSGFGGKHLEMISGKTKQKFELDLYSCFCRTKKTILIPPELQKKENSAFLNRARKELWGESEKQADPALLWILNGQMSHKTYNQAHQIISASFRYKPIWLSKKPVNKTYFVAVGSDTLRKIYLNEGDLPDYFSDSVLVGGILMNGTVLGQYANAPNEIKGEYEIYVSPHSVVVKKGEKWSYAFVTDAELTGAPDKLRWTSIKQVFCETNYIIVRHSRATSFDNSFFIVNFLNGKCAEVNYFCGEDELLELKNGVFYKNGKEFFPFNRVSALLEHTLPD